jgi:hypothetical protein
MGDQEHAGRRLFVECRNDSVYVVEDGATGLRLAGRDFEMVRSAVLEGAALLTKGTNDTVYIFKDAETGLRLAGRDLDMVRSAVLESVAQLSSGTPARSDNFHRGSANRPWWLAPFADLPRTVVLFAPLLLAALLIVASLRPYTQVARMLPESGGLFRTLRVSVLKVDRALQDIDPQNREELLASIRSIVASLKPFADEIRPLFRDGLGRDGANGNGKGEGPKGAQSQP